MGACISGIVMPTLENDNCNGQTKSTDCIIHSASITYLELPENSTMTEIVNALLLSLIDARNRIETLENL